MKQKLMMTFGLVFLTAVFFLGCQLFQSGEAQIVSFSLSGIVGEAEIDPEAKTVTAAVEPVDLSGLEPSVGVSEGASVTPAALVDGEAVTFKITAEDGTVEEWKVTVNVQRGLSFTYASTPTHVVLTNGFVDEMDEIHNAALGDGAPFVSYYPLEELVFVYVLDDIHDLNSNPSEVEYSQFAFPGAAGTYDSTEVFLWYIRYSDTEDFSFSSDDTDADSFSFTVSSYGEVGEDIIGTFSGTAVNGETHTITDGFFKLRRLEDDVPLYTE